MKGSRKSGLAILLLGLSSGAVGSGEYYLENQNVIQTLQDDSLFGSCMAKLSVSPTTIDNRCSADWVTFSCSGDFNPKASGFAKFDVAVASLVTGNKVSVWFDPTKTHNGYCFATRIDLLPQ